MYWQISTIENVLFWANNGCFMWPDVTATLRTTQSASTTPTKLCQFLVPCLLNSCLTSLLCPCYSRRPSKRLGVRGDSASSGEGDPQPTSDQIPSQRELEAKIQCASTLLAWSTHRDNAQRLAKVWITLSLFALPECAPVTYGQELSKRFQHSTKM